VGAADEGPTHLRPIAPSAGPPAPAGTAPTAEPELVRRERRFVVRWGLVPCYLPVA
jgi:hypothetical protein